MKTFRDLYEWSKNIKTYVMYDDSKLKFATIIPVNLPDLNINICKFISNNDENIIEVRLRETDESRPMDSYINCVSLFSFNENKIDEVFMCSIYPGSSIVDNFTKVPIDTDIETFRPGSIPTNVLDLTHNWLKNLT